MKKILILIIWCIALTFNIDSVYAVTKAPLDVTTLDIFEIRQAIDYGLLNYETLAKIYLERIEAYNSQYNAIITVNDNIIEEAKECDKNYTKDKSVLYCMPILVKDNIDVLGMPTTAGTKTLLDSFPYEDAEIVKKLKSKGALIIGKANMSEFAFVANSSKSSHGIVKNSYNLKYSSYGSSGGSAVGVAASLAPLSIGTDTNSSVRAPSSANNLYGMRPTFGLISSEGLFHYDITRDVVGPITKTARENAVLLAVMAGLDEMSFIDNYASLAGKVIGVLTQFVDGDKTVDLSAASPKVKKKFAETIELLKSNNVTIVEIDDFYTTKEQSIVNYTKGGWTMCYAFNEYIKNTNSSIKNFYDLANSKGHIYGLQGYALDCNIAIETIDYYDSAKKSFNKKLEEIFKSNNLDAVIYPTTGNIIAEEYKSNCAKLPSVLGWPAISIPMGEINGLYYGFDLVGLKNSEKTLYEIAISYNDINDTRALPDIAPALYEVPEVVHLLNQYYLDNKDLKINIDSEEYELYEKTLGEIKQFYINYNNHDNVDEAARELLLKFKNHVNILENSVDDKVGISGKVIIGVVLSLLVALFVIFINFRKGECK